MSRGATAVAATVTVLTLLALVVRQVTALRLPAARLRWLTALSLVLTVAFAVAMAVRLRGAL